MRIPFFVPLWIDLTDCNHIKKSAKETHAPAVAPGRPVYRVF
jgi:hypothetical protein